MSSRRTPSGRAGTLTAPAPARPALAPPRLQLLAPPRMGRRVRLLGLPIDVVTHEGAIARIVAGARAGRGGVVVTPNLDQLRLHQARPELRPLYEDAELVVADGMPIVWACALQGTPLPERVAGSDLTVSLAAAAERTGLTIYLLGGPPGTADRAARTLSTIHPALRVAGTSCPPIGFEHDLGEMLRVERDLLAARPDLVLMGLSFPKSLLLSAHMRDLLPRAWFLGIGVSLSFVTGDVRRAPPWMRRAGLEWAHRMIQEPGHLARRYLIDDLPFLRLLMTHALRQRLAARHRHPTR